MLKETAYAKVNLSLKITGQRQDGYHLLDMVMQTVSLSDELTFQESEEPGLRLRASGALPESFFGEDNLILRACLALYERKSGKTGSLQSDLRLMGSGHPGLEITLDKRIPISAGLGGGSADAAAALRALNRLYSLKLSGEELEKIGAGLGADIPFLIRGGTKRVRGVGEALCAETPLREGYFLIAKPLFGISTPWAYQAYDRSEASYTGENDLEKGVLPEYPLIGRLKEFMLEQGAKKALMCGSGSAVFGYFGSEKEAGQAGRKLLSGELAKKLEGIFGAAPVEELPSEEIRR